MELDYSENTRHKAAQIHAHAALHNALGSYTMPSDADVQAERYALFGMDLRELADATAKDASERLARALDPARPTLLLCECVLAYVPPDDADAVLRCILARVGSAALLAYDMIVAGDATTDEEPSRFGSVMLQNLAAQQLMLPGARACASLGAYEARFARLLARCDAHAVHAHACSLRSLWYALERAERERLARIEGLDEVEELEMLLAHYCIVWAERSV